MKEYKILFLLVALASVAFSATFSADFNNERSHMYGDEPWHFNAGTITITPDMTCTVVSSTVSHPVVAGTLCDTPATVCPGTTIRVTPSHESKWASTNPQIYSFYSLGNRCDMEAYSSYSTNRNIRWLSDSTYAKYDAGSGGFAGSDFALYYEGAYTGPGLYSELGTFYLESVTYEATDYNPSDPCSGPQYNKKGEGNVFCNGDMEILRGRGSTFTSLSSDDMGGTLSGAETTFSTEGAYTLRTRVRNAECFASLMKYPKNLDDPATFRLYFFGYDVSPPTAINSADVSVTVEDRQPLLTVLTPIGVTQSNITTSVYLLSINTRNNGDVPVRVTGVRPIGDGSTSPFSSMHCSLYGFPPSVCPSDNGFGSTINVGATKRVYVLFGGDLDGDIAYLTYEPLQPVCSDATSFNATIHLDTGNNTPVRCEIDPSTLHLTPFEIHEWDVTCYNSLDLIVPCVGDNWYFFDAYGGFVDKTDEYAKAYLSSVEGIAPMIVYQTGSVRCTSDLFSHPDEPTSSEDPYSFVCELSPDSAELSIGESQAFTLDCTLEGVPVEPTGAEYSNVHGLDGSLTGGSTDGVTFTGTTNSSGDVQVIAWYGTTSDPTLLGAIDWAHVVVGAGGNETNETGDGGLEDVCELSPSYKEMYAHSAGFVGILCGPSGARVPCSSTTNIEWGVAPELYGGIVSGTTSGATFSIGSDGTPAYGYYTAGVSAVITNSEGEALGHCVTDIFIKEPSCLDYT